MDPNATLEMIDDAERVDAETHEAMRNLYDWLQRGGFPPTWVLYKKGTRRFTKVYGKQRGM